MQVTMYKCRECGCKWESYHQSFECPTCDSEDIMCVGNYRGD